ncbi:MAG: family 20 glycosylhydrolase [Clostridia bacterium]|nr:family 20 glycosylhydrolase [Clostridia bacterium]
MIFPQPIKTSYGDGAYILRVSHNTTDLMELYAIYQNGNEDLTLYIEPTYGEDEYKLTVSADGIRIACGTESGKFRAITSMRQLLHENGESLPFCEIYDKPQFARRGYMLDISRARIPKVETIKRLIDLLSELKYNEFQLYMENFCYKFPHFPQVNADYDCLTPDDMMELDQYCADRFIDLVPNQNCFGHMAVWLAQKEFEHLGVSDGKTKTGTLNILLPETVEFVEKLFDSVLPYFRSKYVNIGLDEAYGLGKFQLEEICREKGKTTVFMQWLGQVSDIIKRKYGKTVMFWSDMVYEAKESFHLIPRGAVALNWGYDLIETALMDRRCAYLEENNIPFYVCPGDSAWLAFTGRFDLMTFNLRTSAEFGYNHGARGYLLTAWGNGNHVHYPVFNLVPLALGAQYAWNTGIEQNGYEMKHPFTRAAQKYVDEYVFDGKKVSHFLYKLAQTYLLEPERIHCSSETPFSFSLRLNETVVPGFMDLAEQDPFYYENVIDYLNKILSALETADIDEKAKRQMVLDARFYVLAAELDIIRINQAVTGEKIDALVALIDWIAEEHRTLWLADNFENGLEKSISLLQRHRAELLEMK